MKTRYRVPIWCLIFLFFFGWAWLAVFPRNPVKNWTCVFSSGQYDADLVFPDATLQHKYKKVIDDYQNYINETQTQHPAWWISTIEIYESSKGQHAVKFTIEVAGREYQEFYLMYDKSDQRAKIIKGKSWHQFHI